MVRKDLPSLRCATVILCGIETGRSHDDHEKGNRRMAETAIKCRPIGVVGV